MGEGYHRVDIEAKMGRKFGLSPRTANRYMRIVRDRWLAAADLRSATLFEERLNHHQRTVRELRREKQYAPMVALEKHIDDMLGLKAPEKHDHRVAVLAQAPLPPLDLEHFSSEFLTAAAAEALREGVQIAPGEVLALPEGSDDHPED